MKKPGRYFCYTDGACRKSDGAPGGWGVFIKCPDGATLENHGGAVKTDNSTMELTAVAEALRLVPDGVPVTLFSDSRSALDWCSRGIPIWRKNGWKGVTPGALELLRTIDTLWAQKSLEIEWTWIRGHGGNTGNERADELADQGARQAKAEIVRERKLKGASGSSR